MNDKQWHEWRKKGLGGSDLPIIMGDSPYKTAYELWLEKTGKVEADFEPNFIQQKGHDFEVIARNKFEIMTEVEWRPALVEHKEYPQFRSSLDGINYEKNEIWECKYIGKEGFSEVQNGKVPQKYKAQVQWQLFVTGAKVNHFFVMNDEHETAHAIVEPEPAYIKKIVDKAFDFWNCVTNDIAPKMTDKDKVEIKDKNILEKIHEYQKIEESIKDNKAMLESVKKEIFELIPHSNCFVNDQKHKITIQKQKRAGSVDWKKLCSELEIVSETQEKFRKKPSSVKVIRITEKK